MAPEQLEGGDVDRLLSKALAKNADERYQNVADMIVDLRLLSRRAGTKTAAVAPPRNRRRSTLRLAALCGLTLATALAAFVVGRITAPEGEGGFSKPVRYDIALPDELEPYRDSLCLAPDTSKLVFAGGRRARNSLWLYDLESALLGELPGTEGATKGVFSPNGRFVAFKSGTSLKKIDLERRMAQTIAELPDGTFHPNSWSANEEILLGGLGSSTLYVVSADGGMPMPIGAQLAAFTAARGADWLNDGRRFVFYHMRSATIRLGSVQADQTEILTTADTRAEYVPPDHLLFVREGRLFAQQFDPRSEVVGRAVVLAEGVEGFPGPALATFSASERAVAFRRIETRSRLQWFDRRGVAQQVVGGERAYDDNNPWLRISPDGRSVAIAVMSDDARHRDLWTIKLENGQYRRVAADPENELYLIWSPSGNALLFNCGDNGPSLCIQSLAGDAPPERLSGRLKTDAFTRDWTARDGGHLLYRVLSHAGLFGLPLRQGAAPYSVVSGAAGFARFSPDGSWIAYGSNESGSWRIYVARFEPGERARDALLVPGGVGRRPVWRRDGRELFFRREDGMLIGVPITLSDRPQFGAPQELFVVEDAYDVAPDGERFLVRVPTADDNNDITVILNWRALLD